MGKQFVLLVYFTFLCFTLLGSSELSSVSVRYYQSEELTRIPEYFSGNEFTGNRLFCRTSDNKKGLYFSFSLPAEIVNSSAQMKALLSIIRSDQFESVKYQFTIPRDRKEKKEIFLGITGKNWPDEDLKPLAWRIELKNAKDELLFLKNSFLWDHNE